MNLLLVDDDPKFRSYMRQGLEESGLSVEVVASAEEAQELLRKRPANAFDLLLLDVMLPQSSGWSLLSWLRGQDDPTPVIFVTARGAVEERVRGLKLGADDYVIKPFEFSELLARIEAVRRRREMVAELVLGELRLDLERHAATCRGVPVEMSPREFDLLLVLARARGRVVTREELLGKVWGMHFDPGTNVVNVLVARLRRRLEPWVPDAIRTVIGEGYALALEGSTGRGAERSKTP